MHMVFEYYYTTYLEPAIVQCEYTMLARALSCCARQFETACRKVWREAFHGGR